AGAQCRGLWRRRGDELADGARWNPQGRSPGVRRPGAGHSRPQAGIDRRLDLRPRHGPGPVRLAPAGGCLRTGQRTRPRYPRGNHQMGVAFRGQVTRSIPVEESSQVGQVRREALGLANAAGFGEIDGGRVALVATEVATNVLRHGHGGQVLLSLVQGRNGLGVEVCGIDQGSGFSLSRCLPDGYSTAGSPGQGLGAIQRQSQVFEVWSDARGAVVVSRIYAADAPGNDLGYGALRVPMRRQAVCGDAWLLGWDGPQLVAVLIDGLGHGLQACEAAEEGLAAAADAPGLAADELLARMHGCMSRTRGGAAAVFRHDSDSG